MKAVLSGVLCVAVVSCLLAAGTKASAAEGGPKLWSLTMIQLPGDWEALRLNTSTGQVWAAQGGKWVGLNDPNAPPSPGEIGTYELHATYGSESKAWYALRFNVKTGECWSLSGRDWKLVANE